MKIIDQTPYVDEKGEISLLDKAKATLKFGPSWYAEIQAQKNIMNFMERGLDRGYTLLRNFTLPGTQATIPMILVGPPGIFVLYVTNLTGMYRAKGDEWGIMDHNTFRLVSVNLLTRTARMARAVQVFLERQGYMLSTTVEGILVGANPSLHVDSVRPIVRVVLSDAMDRFVVSIAQARLTMGSEGVQEVVSRLQNPRPVKKPGTAIPPQPEPVIPTVPAYESRKPEPSQLDGLSESLGFAFENPPRAQEQAPSLADSPFTPVMEGSDQVFFFEPEPDQRPTRTRFSRKQWGLLLAFGVIEIIILIIFGVMVLSDFL